MPPLPPPDLTDDTFDDPALAVLQRPGPGLRLLRALMVRMGKWGATAFITVMAVVLSVAFTALGQWAVDTPMPYFTIGLLLAVGVSSVVAPLCCMSWMSLLDYQIQLEHSYRALAMGDVLTGLPNRRWIVSKGEHAGALDGQPLSVLLIDIDHFKSVNDTWGHQVGDEVLRHVAQVLSGTLRRGDFIGRFGGEEFLVLTSDASPRALAEQGERLRAVVAASPLRLDGRLHAVTISVGGAVMDDHRADDRFGLGIREADLALYEAKRQGRDRVCMAPLGVEPSAGTTPWTVAATPRRANRDAPVG